MPKLRIVAENYSDEGTLTGTPTFATSINNMQTQSRAKISRSNITNWAPTYNQEIELVLPGIKTVSAIVLGNHNFSVGMIIKFVLYDTDDTIIYNSGDIEITSEYAENSVSSWGSFLWGPVGWGANALATDYNQQANYVHWTLTDNIIDTPITDDIYYPVFSAFTLKIFCTLSDTKQLDIGRLIVGDYLEPRYNLGFNHSIEWLEESNQYRTEGYTLRSDVYLPVKKLSFSINNIDAADRTSLTEGLRYVGLRNDFYINLFPDSESFDKELEYSGIMKLTKVPTMSEYALNIYKSKYVMEEV